MFQFPPFAPYAYGFSVGQFRDPGINARLTASPGLSQFSTPFFASWRQDIPHMPLVAWPHLSRSRSVSPRTQNRIASSYRPIAARRPKAKIPRTKKNGCPRLLLSLLLCPSSFPLGWVSNDPILSLRTLAENSQETKRGLSPSPSPAKGEGKAKRITLRSCDLQLLPLPNCQRTTRWLRGLTAVPTNPGPLILASHSKNALASWRCTYPGEVDAIHPRRMHHTLN
jgi:hypothetical protein